MHSTKITLSRYECAHLLGISVRLLDKCIAEGKINAVRLGDRVLIPCAELEKLTKSARKLKSKKDLPDSRRSKTIQAVRRRQVGR